MSCRFCDSVHAAVIYDGPIRAGGVGSSTVEGHKVLQCGRCGFVYLHPVPENLDTFYETPEYRSQWDYAFSHADIQKKYDVEQNERIARIGVQNVRGRAVLDLGAAAGLFLDAVQGVAARTVAVEPGSMYKDHLTGKGHHYYMYPDEAIRAGEKVDVVTCFDVIEHVPRPRTMIEAASALLKRGGTFVLSMPNLHDLIRDVHRETFEPFVFQVAHLNYFGAEFIPALFAGTGFTDVKVDHLHKYGIENLVRWAKYGAPGAVPELDGVFDRLFNAHYRAEVERLGIASHLFITARREGGER